MNYLTGLIRLAGLKLNRQIADAANVRRRLFAKWLGPSGGGHWLEYPVPRIKVELYCSLVSIPFFPSPRKTEISAQASVLNYFAYNFIKIHRTLRMSPAMAVAPAMAAGVTDRLWSVEDLVALWEAYEQRRAERVAQMFFIRSEYPMLLFLITVVFLATGRLLPIVPVGMLDQTKREKATIGMQILMSLIFTSAAFYIVLSHSYNPQEEHWAYGSLGTILGFWLKGPK